MPISTPWVVPTRPSPTPWNGRPTLERANTIAPIITGIWDDLNTWLETGKFWNDNGDGAGTSWITPR